MYQASIKILTSVWSTLTSLQSASIPSGLTNQITVISQFKIIHSNYKELQQHSQ
jgi:hypothetical protein